MVMPRSRRQFLTIAVGVLFAANLFGLFFVLRSAFTPASDVSSAQFAAGALATSHGESPKPLTEACNPGEVHVVKQAKKGTKPERTTSKCFERNAQGAMVQTPGV